jgi:hypothetical protein
MRRDPIPNWFHFNTGGFESPYQNVITTKPYLRGAVEKSNPRDGAFGASREVHVGKLFAELLAKRYLGDCE